MVLPNLVPNPPRLTVDEYLAFERAAEERHIYVDGEVFAMAGESLAHAIISANMVGALVQQLKGTPCFAVTKDTKVRSGPTPEPGRSRRGMFSYPDIVVICGEAEFHDAHRDIILNPTAIFEVLSPSTEAFDRGDKLHRLQKWNPTLTDYILVAQDQLIVDHFSLGQESTWTFRSHTSRDAVLAVASINVSLRLSDLYDRMELPEGPEDDDSTTSTTQPER